MMLIVVERSKTDTFQSLTTQFAGNPNVRVIMDRRKGERRRRAADDRVPDRRVRDRRRGSHSFDGRDFFVVLTSPEPTRRLVIFEPTLCVKCGSHRTRTVGRSGSRPVTFWRCEACEFVFTRPAQ